MLPNRCRSRIERHERPKVPTSADFAIPAGNDVWPIFGQRQVLATLATLRNLRIIYRQLRTLLLSLVLGIHRITCTFTPLLGAPGLDVNTKGLLPAPSPPSVLTA